MERLQYLCRWRLAKLGGWHTIVSNNEISSSRVRHTPIHLYFVLVPIFLYHDGAFQPLITQDVRFPLGQADDKEQTQRHQIQKSNSSNSSSSSNNTNVSELLEEDTQHTPEKLSQEPEVAAAVIDGFVAAFVWFVLDRRLNYSISRERCYSLILAMLSGF